MAKVVKETFVLRTTARFFRHHPLVLLSLLLLIVLYKYFFQWFAFLVAASPVFLFTGFFLGVILAYGEPNVPGNDHVYKKIQNVHCNGNAVRGRSLPRIQFSEENVTEIACSGKKTRERCHDHGSSSEPGWSDSDSSDTDTMPMLNAFRQFRSTATSSRSSLVGDTDVSSAEEGTENQEENDDDECGEKEGAKVMSWTADDQKNLQNIGSLEIERNQRLENLIARRRARKYTERNLIDFDGIDSVPSIEELSKFNVQIPAVFAPRKNPFDLTYEGDDFPDSAPSVLLPMRNPFDQACEQASESGSTAGASSSHQETAGPVASPPLRNAVFRRHESFTVGAPYFSDFRQDLRPSRFRPYFVTEKMVNEGMIDPILEGDNSEKSESKVSSVQDSDSASSITDQENQREVLEDSSKQEREPPFSQTDRRLPSTPREGGVPIALDIQPPVLISDSSDDDISLPGEQTKDWQEENDGEGIDSARNVLLEDPSGMEHHREMETTGKDFHPMSPHSDDGESISSSTEASEKPSEVNNIKLPSNEVEVADHAQSADPVYDSSPSGNEEPVSIVSALNEALLHQGNSGADDAQASIQGLTSVEDNELRERVMSTETRGSDISDHDVTREGFTSSDVPGVSDVSSQPATSSSTYAWKSGKIISSSKKAVFGLFKK